MSEQTQLVEKEFGQLGLNALFFLPPQSGLSQVKMIKFDHHYYRSASGGGNEYYAGAHKKVLISTSEDQDC